MSESRLLTLRDYIRWAVSRFHAAGLFFGHGTDNAWDEARHLVLGSLHLPWEISDSYLDCRLEDDERAELAEILRRRIEERIPAAYLLGEAWFCGIPFSVDERVLVPRSPIAELIEQRFAPWLPAEPARILDLCTGSGCIGIACAYAFEQAEVVLADLSFDALEVANVNIERHDLGERVYTRSTCPCSAVAYRVPWLSANSPIRLRSARLAPGGACNGCSVHVLPPSSVVSTNDQSPTATPCRASKKCTANSGRSSSLDRRWTCQDSPPSAVDRIAPQ